MSIDVTLQQAREPVAVMSIQGEINAWNFVQVVDKARSMRTQARNLNLSEVPSNTGLAAIHQSPDRSAV